MPLVLTGDFNAFQFTDGYVDVMGQITAEFLGAETVVTPVSSNSGVMQKGFGAVVQTRIGSPYVIAGMEAAGGRVAGYEANGGFLLGFDAKGPSGPLSALLTRLAAGGRAGGGGAWRSGRACGR